ncbi:uncharacterized protein LOC143911567 isoform X2 [Arctopsyche grandis]|uniref:uncharacterized protein LOC143911567 isoform X2 n=1 Tax=Arctopsyche grandis TaxID=121162 RepID=UPI00406D76E5
MEEERRSPCASASATVTMVDVLEQQTAVERDAHAVLGGSDDAVCTFVAGYVKRQALYACLTCTPVGSSSDSPPAGICLACSLACHERHDLLELYTKRNFRCDCGGPKFDRACTLGGRREQPNTDNKYNHNFSGLYCQCERPYPDPDQTSDDDMIQCVVCEDWLHAGHLEAKLPHNDRYAEMICNACTNENPFLKDYLCFAVTNDEDDTLDDTANLTLDTSAPIIHSVVSTGVRPSSDEANSTAENTLNVEDVSMTEENSSQTQVDARPQDANVVKANNVEKTEENLASDANIQENLTSNASIQENRSEESQVTEKDENVDETPSSEQKHPSAAEENEDIPNVREILDADSENQFSPSPKIELENENVNQMLDNGDDAIGMSDMKENGDFISNLNDSQAMECENTNSIMTEHIENSNSMPQLENILNSDEKDQNPSNLDTLVTPENSTNMAQLENILNSDDKQDMECENTNNEDTLKDVDTLVTPENSLKMAQLENILSSDDKPVMECENTNNEDTLKDIDTLVTPETTVKMAQLENILSSDDKPVMECENTNNEDTLKDIDTLVTPETTVKMAQLENILSSDDKPDMECENANNEDTLKEVDTLVTPETSLKMVQLENILSSDDKQDMECENTNNEDTLKEVDTLVTPETSLKMAELENILSSDDKQDMECENTNNEDTFKDLETPVTPENPKELTETDKLDNVSNLHDKEQTESENTSKIDTLTGIETPVISENPESLTETCQLENVSSSDDKGKIESENISNACVETPKTSENCEDLPQIDELENVLSSNDKQQTESEDTKKVDTIEDIETPLVPETPEMSQPENIPSSEENQIESESIEHMDVLKDVEMLITPENNETSTEMFQSGNLNENKIEINSTIENSALVENDLATPVIVEPAKHDDVSTNSDASDCPKIDIPTEESVKEVASTSDVSESLNNLENLSNNQDIPKAIDEVNSSEIQNEDTIKTHVNSEDNQKIEPMTVDKPQTEDNTDKIVPDETENNASVQNGIEQDTVTNGDAVEMQHEENVLKRKIDTKSIKMELLDVNSEEPIKKQKLDNGVKCIRPVNSPPVEHKGAIFWPCDWRTKLCTCPVCTEMYKKKNVLFLLDTDDTVIAYENLGKTRTSASQYEKGLEALSSLDRIQQINAITEYNKMKEKLLEFLKTFKDKREVVREEDIKGFFAGMKPKREPDGVYFCR